jgi:hypothetical protein
MRTREFHAEHHNALGMSFNQAVELSKAMVGHPFAGSHLKATGAGRGPGSGPAANPHNVAMFILAALRGGPQTRSGDAAAELWHLRADFGPADGGWGTPPGPRSPGMARKRMQHPLRRADCLGNALTATLADPVLAASVDRIEVRRAPLAAGIFMRNGDGIAFVTDAAAAVDAEGLRVVATISGAALRSFAADLAARP